MTVGQKPLPSYHNRRMSGIPQRREPCRACAAALISPTTAAALISPTTTALDFDDATWREAKRAPQSPKIPVYIPPPSRCLRHSWPSTTLRRHRNSERDTAPCVQAELKKRKSFMAGSPSTIRALQRRPHGPTDPLRTTPSSLMTGRGTWWDRDDALRACGISIQPTRRPRLRRLERIPGGGGMLLAISARQAFHPTSTIPRLSSSRKVKREAAEERPGSPGEKTVRKCER
ncbi:hypothetical protein D9611_011386 [Ephemerocybe angulata]|uniref:Uncharacterized protein n=1 Tax=Ephemerocybe angulata TaxID=980116 RepID=A0A8H5BBY3_9AGAR|nr:hypothetical protein D9611_011386 [Tulosesus angulatus]